MIENNFFPNPFDDYTPENLKLLIEDGELRKDHFIVQGLSQKWHETLPQISSLHLSDSSVYTGTPGIALLKLRYDSEDKANLEEAASLVPLNLRGKCYTFLCGDAGPLSINAVIYSKLYPQELKKYLHFIERLKLLGSKAMDQSSGEPNEYLYGRAGYLYGLMFVNKNISPPPIDDTFIRNIIDAILLSGKICARNGKFQCPLMYQWHGSYYLGAAHGLSGILYLLLQVKEYLSESELNELVKPTIDYLVSLKFPSGNFPSSIGREKDKYVQWCHGAPGFVHLFSTAYKVFNDQKYLNLALDCGDVIWTRGLCRKGYSICHGVSGNAYSFLELYQNTRDEKHLYRAIKFAEWCFMYTKKHEQHPPDRPHSLYEGTAGPMYLFLDILKPLEAKFPGFTL